MSVKIILNSVGQITPLTAIRYLMTGVIPDAPFTASLSDELRTRYLAATAEDQLRWRMNAGAILVTDGEVKDGKWEPVFGVGVTVYPRDPNSMFTRDIEISTSGTTRSIERTKSFLDALDLAYRLAASAKCEIDAAESS